MSVHGMRAVWGMARFEMKRIVYYAVLYRFGQYLSIVQKKRQCREDEFLYSRPILLTFGLIAVE